MQGGRHVEDGQPSEKLSANSTWATWRADAEVVVLADVEASHGYPYAAGGKCSVVQVVDERAIDEGAYVIADREPLVHPANWVV